MCPASFISYDGYEVGPRIRGYSEYSATLDKCGKDCSGKYDCKFFSYSSSKTKCKLMTERTPTDPKWKFWIISQMEILKKDHQFCSKGKTNVKTNKCLTSVYLKKIYLVKIYKL